MYATLGWINVALLAVMLLPYLLRLMGSRIFHWKGKGYIKTLKGLRTLHKPLGAVLVISVVAHGVMALGAWRLHTGMILGGVLVITATLGLSFYISKKKELFAWHKRSMAVVVVMVLIHLIFPSAIYTLFGI